MTDNFNVKAVNAIRYLGLKAIKEAKGGHVGMTISAAPITYTLFTKFINIHPNDGKWINRDRFVLSGGHGSMSVYPILYMSGLMPLKELKNFKMENSQTPGHPEYELHPTNFIDASTGPLGQGLAMAVGMALAEKTIRTKTKEEFPYLFKNYTYVVCGDGDLQEGVSYEAMAIAGKYKLGKLIVLHDSNKYQLDTSVEEVSIEDLKLRCESNNWHYQKCSNNPASIEKAILNAQKTRRPSFIEVETIIAEGLSVGDSAKGHHGVITDSELNKFQEYHKTNFKGWEIGPEILDHFKKNVAQRGYEAYKKWETTANQYKKEKPLQFDNIWKFVNNEFNYKELFQNVRFEKQDQATRVYLKSFLAALNNQSPFAIATCADLVSSTNIIIGDKNVVDGGHNLPIGIREFAMGAIINGFNLYSHAFKIIGGTFLVFADYIKSAIRIGALMKLPAIYAFTHDSYQVGGDGPTHQPYDQLPMLRAIDNVLVYRPADEEELRYAISEAYSSKHKTHVLALTRQNIPSLNKIVDPQAMAKGAYIVQDASVVDYVLAASGSEVALALEVAKRVENVRVVSVPCLDKAKLMSSEEKKALFGAHKVLITLEASSDYSWLSLHVSNQKNLHLGAFSFGKSMDGNKLYQDKGFNVDFIIETLNKYN